MDMTNEKILFKKIDEMNININDIKIDIGILKSREQPSSPCRNYMGLVESGLKEDCNGIKKDLNELGVKVDKKANIKDLKYIFGIFTVMVVAAWNLVQFFWDIYKQAKG